MSRVRDVAIIGAGPVGLVAASLLGRADVDVVLIERYPNPFGLPRAIRFDHEAMRVWQELGIAGQLLEDALPVTRYEWFGADGELIVDFEIPPGPSGWDFSYVFYQPHLESALEQVVERERSVEVRRGLACIDLRQTEDCVEIDVRASDPQIDWIDDEAERETLRARYVIGADGAGSTVRELSGIGLEDRGFGERWIVIDVEPNGPDVAARFKSFPTQFADPRRPHMLGPNGRRHRRWEFMLMPEESAADFIGDGRVWELLSPWLSPSEATIVRSAVYEFRAAMASSMQAGRRVFLAGDSAHRMPPHLGEGLCSGIRDAKAIAWRLPLVLTGADEGLLESYEAERLPHTRVLVEQSLAMGQVSCERDPAAAAERDRRIRADGGVEPWPVPSLGPGLGHSDTGATAELVGTLSVQGLVDGSRTSGLFDDVVGRGFVLIVNESVPVNLDDASRASFEALGGRVAALGVDITERRGEISAWLRAHEAAAVLVRPDFYVFGAVSEAGEVNGLVEALLEQLDPSGHFVHS